MCIEIGGRFILCASVFRFAFEKWTDFNEKWYKIHVIEGYKNYSDANKSLALPWKETSYNDQDLQHYTKTYGVQTTGIYSCCLYAVSLDIVL